MIERIEGIDDKPELDSLIIYGNRIREIEGLGGLPNLKNLEI